MTLMHFKVLLVIADLFLTSCTHPYSEHLVMDMDMIFTWSPRVWWQWTVQEDLDLRPLWT